MAWWVKVSIPGASPEITVSPASAKSRAISEAICFPYEEHFLVPTIAKQDSFFIVRSPLVYKILGGSGSSLRKGG